VVGWDDFVAGHFGTQHPGGAFKPWSQGEHVSLIGPTGSGKSTLEAAILPLRQYVILFATKPSGRDDTLNALTREKANGRKVWKVVTDVKALPKPAAVRPGINDKVLFWPKYKTPSDVHNQAFQLWAATQQAFLDGGWTLAVDETSVWVDRGLKSQLVELWKQARSLKVSLIAGTQRPANVPLEMYDQATHVFFWRDNDERNLKRISGMNGLNARLIRATVSTLEHHQVLYINTRTGAMVRTKAPQK